MATTVFVQKYRQVLGVSNYFLALAVAFSAAFPLRVVNIVWVMWLISWLLEGRFLNKNNFSFDKYKTPVIMLAGFYVLQAISLLWASDQKAGISVIERQMSFLAIVPIALFGVNKYYKTSSILISLVAGVLVSVIAYIMSLLYVNNYDFFIQGGDKSYWKGFSFENFTNWIYLIKHRLYYNTILVIAIFSLPFLYKKFAYRYGRTITYVVIISVAIVILTMIYMTGSRSMILALILIVTVALFRVVNMRYRAIVIVGLITLFFVGVFLFVKFHPRMNDFKSDDFEALKTGKTNNELIEPRLLIWHVVFENANDYYLYGLGVGNSTEFLVEQYKLHNYPEIFQIRKFGTHNQFFSAFMELGIFGAMYLVLVLVLYHRFFTGKARHFAFYFLILMSFNMLTEGILGRLDGVVTLSFFTLLCLWMQAEDNRKLKLKNAENIA